MRLIDAHCHLANLAEIMPVPALITEAKTKGIEGFISSVLKRSEIAWHRKQPQAEIIWQAGIHPSFDECDLELDEIRSLGLSSEISAIGEIGLDRNNPELEWQKEQFKFQLEMAHEMSMPVCLHVVGHQDLAYSYLKQYSNRYMVHGYAGSLEGFELLMRLDSYFTISSRILKDDKRELLRAMVESGRIMFETDITRYYVKEGETNPLLRLLDVFESVKQASGRSEQELIDMQDRSLEAWLGRVPW